MLDRFATGMWQGLITFFVQTVTFRPYAVMQSTPPSAILHTLGAPRLPLANLSHSHHLREAAPHVIAEHRSTPLESDVSQLSQQLHRTLERAHHLVALGPPAHGLRSLAQHLLELVLAVELGDELILEARLVRGRGRGRGRGGG